MKSVLPCWWDETMNKRRAYVILFVAFLPLAGCATGKAWYCPYGHSYFKDAPGPRTINEFLSQPRPK